MTEEVLNQEVYWERVTPQGVEYVATVKGHLCRLRMNNFPEEPLYTLTVGTERVNLDDAPKSWHFPWKQL
jgi:hypothetical protein